MALGGIYETGTISVAQDSAEVTGAGVLWSDVLEGDWLLPVGHSPLPIAADVVDPYDALTLQAPWPGETLEDADYIILKMSWKRYDPSLTQAKLRQLLTRLEGVSGIYYLPDDAAPPVGLGTDGQFAVTISSSFAVLWFRTGGAWVQQTGFGGPFQPRGAWDNETIYAQSDLVEHEGFAFLSNASDNVGNEPVVADGEPQSNEHWTLLPAFKGDKGDTGDGLDYDARVDELADRDAYDEEDQGFRVLVSDTGDGRAAVYEKLSGSSADWSGPIYVTGPAGTDGADGTGLFSRVRVVDTGEGDPATDYEDGDEIDGVTLAENDLVLRASPGGDADDGIYVVPSSGAAARAPGFATYNAHPGVYVSVMEGTINADTLWRCTSDKGGTLDSDPLVFSEFSSSDDILTTRGDIAVRGASAVERLPLGGAGTALVSDGTDLGYAELLGGLKNRIINGNFDIWQRGTILSAATGLRFLADRWHTIGDGSTCAPSRQSFTLGQTDLPGEPLYFHRVVVASSAGANNRARCQQLIEGVRTFAGQTATLSFYAKADAAKNIAVEFVQNFGTGGSPSSIVLSIGVTTVALGTTWAKYTITVAIPSIAGKTIGTDRNDCLEIGFWFDAGSDFNARTNSLGQQSGTFDIAQVQLEPGSIATAFEQRPLGLEEGLCRRYFILMIWVRLTLADATSMSISTLDTRMRTTPTIVVETNGDGAEWVALGAQGFRQTIAASTFGAVALSFAAEL